MYIYKIEPIDFFEGMQSLEHYLLGRYKEIEYLKYRNREDEAFEIEKGIHKVMQLYTEAVAEIKTKTMWEGDVRSGPSVFVLPCVSENKIGFVIKQDHNGDTFVASPLELTWLGSEEKVTEVSSMLEPEVELSYQKEKELKEMLEEAYILANDRLETIQELDKDKKILEQRLRDFNAVANKRISDIQKEHKEEQGQISKLVKDKYYIRAEKFLSEHPGWTVDDALKYFDELEKKEEDFPLETDVKQKKIESGSLVIDELLKEYSSKSLNEIKDKIGDLGRQLSSGIAGDDYKLVLKKYHALKEHLANKQKKIEPLIEEEDGEVLGERLGYDSNIAIFENPWNEFENFFCDGKVHLYSEAIEMFKKYERYNRYNPDSLKRVRLGYLNWACTKYLLERKKSGGRKPKFLLVEKHEEEIKEEPLKKIEPLIEEELLKLGEKLGFVGRDAAIYENPWNEFERLFCDGNGHSHSEVIEMLRRYERYNQYNPVSFKPLRVRYFKWARKEYQIERTRTMVGRFKFLPLKKRVEEEIKEEPLVAERVAEKRKMPVEDEYGKRFYSDIVEKVHEVYPGAAFHADAVKELTQELTEGVQTVMGISELRSFFGRVLTGTYHNVSNHRIRYYILYFKIVGMVVLVRDKRSPRYEIHKDNLIPRKKKLGILEKLGMRKDE